MCALRCALVCMKVCISLCICACTCACTCARQEAVLFGAVPGKQGEVVSAHSEPPLVREVSAFVLYVCVFFGSYILSRQE